MPTKYLFLLRQIEDAENFIVRNIEKKHEKYIVFINASSFSMIPSTK